MILILILLSYFYFIFGNGIFSLTNPDEVFYVQTAKEMVQHHSWMVPYLFGQPQFEKPIFLYWLLRIGFIIFGKTSFSARFFPALFACLGVIGTYVLCLFGFGNRKKAFICSLILLSSVFYIGLARTVFTDMIFSVWILLALVSFYWGYTSQKRKVLSIFLFFIFAALAVLTKGPLGLITPFLIIIVFLWLEKRLVNSSLVPPFSKGGNSGGYWLWGLFIFAVISLPWYILMIKKYGNSFVHEFFYNDHIRRIFQAEHLENDTWYFYPLSMIMSMFPWCLYVGAGLFYLFKKFPPRPIPLPGGERVEGNICKINPIYLFLISWISVVFLIFQPAHSKLTSYIFPLFPALAILSGDFIYEAAVDGKNKKALFYTSLITLLFLAIVVVGLIVFLFVSPKIVLIYMGSKTPVLILLLLLLILTGLFSIFVIRFKFIESVYVLTLFIPVVLSVVPFTYKTIEQYISSRDICLYLLKNYEVNNTILCSKPFVRGIKYYTDKDVAVMDIPGKKFFSSHPIDFLDGDHKALELFRKQKFTYCIFKKSSVADIERFPVDIPPFGEEFQFKLLKKIGNQYLVKIEPRT